MLYSEQIFDYLKRFTVGIAGCGGIGSSCASALARAGVGRLILADFDLVTMENYRRQSYFIDQIGRLKIYALKENLLRINPNVVVKAFDIKLCKSDIRELFNHCDVIIEAVDRPEIKHLIAETVINEMPGKTLVMGIGVAGWGDSASIKAREIGMLIVCGDQISEVSDLKPPVAPRVAIVGNMQANEALNVLLKDFKPYYENQI